MARVSAGDRVPDVRLARLSRGMIEEMALQALVAGKRAIAIGVPGAFTPVCTREHVPDFVARARLLRQQGYDPIICVTPNDPWVNEAWRRVVDPVGEILFLSDGNLDLARALGATVLERELFVGERSARYLMVTYNAKIERLTIEPSLNGLTCTRSEDVLMVD